MKEDNFNIYISNAVVLIIFFTILYTFSFFTLNCFLKAKAVHSRLVCHLCYISLTTAFGAILLLPGTIASYGVLSNWPDINFFMWLNRYMVYSLWDSIFISTNVSLFIVLPFTYFFYEIEFSMYPTLPLRQKIVEATINWIMWSIVLGGIIYVLHSITDLFQGEPPELIPFSYSLITTFGSLIVMGCMPLGFVTLTESGLSFRKIPVYRSKEKLFIKKNMLQHKLAQHDSCYGEKTLEKKEDIQAKLARTDQLLKLENSKPQKCSGLKITLRSLVAAVSTVVNLILPLLICIRTAMGLFVHVIWGLQKQGYYDFLNPDPENGTGLIHTLISLVLVIYITVSAFTGYFHMEWLNPIHPKWKDTPLGFVIFNTTVIIIMSSSLPVVARILGVIPFELMGNFKNTFYLNNYYFLAIYKSTFFFVLAQKYFQYFPIFHYIPKSLNEQFFKKLQQWITPKLMLMLRKKSGH